MDKKHILLVEDSPTQARLASLLLESSGYQVTIAVTGSQALEYADTIRFDLVLLDVVLPDLDGFTVCRRLRQKPGAYIPILMFTEQRTAVEDRVDGLAMGADEYLSKPYDRRELLARVTALLRIKQVIDELHMRLTDEYQSYQALRHIALTDHLTGLSNRHFFAEELEREFGRARCYNTPLACVMVDIDHFRDFNALYGHVVGDTVLQGIARILKSAIRQGDIVARYGGEEFVILLPMTLAAATTAIADHLREMIESTAWNGPNKESLYVTVSLGAACFPSPGMETAEHLLEAAEHALTQAKANGRNRVELATFADLPPDELVR